MHIPSNRECALLLLRMLQSKDKERISDGKTELTRARLSFLTLRKLWSRPSINPLFLEEVNTFLFQSGWALFLAGDTYAVVRIEAVESWVRVSWKRIASEVDAVTWEQVPLDVGERSLSDVADWGPAEDWSDWADAAR